MFELGRIGIIGGGSWATAIAKIVEETPQPLNWYMHDQNTIEHMKKMGNNPMYLSSVEFDTKNLNLSSDVNEVVANSDTILFVIPSAYLKSALQDLKVPLADKTVVSAIKGIVPDENLLVGDYLHKFHKVPYNNIGIITGPCHAEEIALERLSYITVAFTEEEKAIAVSNMLKNRYVRTIISDDILGTEYAAVLKNIYALAAGVCLGLGYGDNFMAVLISNAIREMKRFTDIVYPINRDIKDSAYLGDLLVTAYSQFSRNRYFGTMIGKGYSVEHIKNEMNMVAEGYFASKCIHEINKKHNVDMPIAECIYNILYEEKSPRSMMKALTEKLS